MTIVYLHGAHATPTSFNYIRNQIAGRGHSEIILKYDCADGFYVNLNAMELQLSGVKDIFFIGHSLGGIFALHLADRLHGNVLGAVTLATPYAGSMLAQTMNYIFLSRRPWLRDVGCNAPPIKNGLAIGIKVPWLNIVPTHGYHDLLWEPNDGVVTISSMRARSDMRLVDVDTNHYEVMLAPSSVDHILDHMKEVSALASKAKQI